MDRVRELQAFAIRVGRFGTCTECAERVAEKFGGVVVGFFHADNPTAQVAEAEDGHDFAIVEDRYLGDPWQSSVYGDAAVYDLTRPEDVARARELYGDPAQWQFNGTGAPSKQWNRPSRARPLRPAVEYEV